MDELELLREQNRVLFAMLTASYERLADLETILYLQDDMLRRTIPATAAEVITQRGSGVRVPQRPPPRLSQKRGAAGLSYYR